MSNKPIYLTTKRLMYNVARVEFEKGWITEQELNRRKTEWEAEYNNDTLQQKLKKKYDTK